MTIMNCSVEGEPGYKNGASGECFIYKMGDKESRAKAKAYALKATPKEVKKTAEPKEMRIIKTDSGFNTVLFVALTPLDEDRNGDVITEDEITKTAHDFVKNLINKVVNVDHQEDTDMESAEFVESFIAPVDIPVGLETIIKGSWVVGIRFDDTTYKAIQEGDFVGISIEWSGIREKAE